MMGGAKGEMALREGEVGGRQGVFVWRMMGGVGPATHATHQKSPYLTPDAFSERTLSVSRRR